MEILTFLFHAQWLRALQGLVFRSAEGRAEDRHSLTRVTTEMDDVVLASDLTPELVWNHKTGF